MDASKKKILDQLKSLGVNEGDVIFVTSDLMKVGYFRKDRAGTLRDWIDIFQQLLGSTGTIILPSYSEVSFRFGLTSSNIYTPSSESTSGSLANAYIRLAPHAIRSPHPIYSCIGVGPLADELRKYTARTRAYDPYGIVIENGGKNLMLGTIDEVNCPMTFHYAQQTLGHTATHPLNGFFKTSYLDETGNKRVHIMREMGGCTRGVHNLWGRHLAKKAVVFGEVGRSLSGLVDTSRSYEIFVDLLKKRPDLIRCNNKLCISCYGRYRYNGAGAVAFYPKKIYHMAARYFGINI